MSVGLLRVIWPCYKLLCCAKYYEKEDGLVGSVLKLENIFGKHFQIAL